MSTQVSIKQLLEAGVHFGHQTRRWNPKMARYIFGERNGIYIIDLQKTHKKLGEALEYVRSLAEKKGVILFVGTKKQAQEPVQEAAQRCGMPFVNQRWLGGMLTNFATVRKSLQRYQQLKRQKEDGSLATLPKEEIARKERELVKLTKALSGFETLRGLPDAIFIIDTKKERNAVAEAKRLQIPLVALADTNCDPDEVDYAIPSNDDAIRTLKLMTTLLADAVIEGRQAAAAAEQAAKDKKAEAAAPAA